MLSETREIAEGVVSWTGRVEGRELSDVTFIVQDDDVLAGSVRWPGTTYLVKWASPGTYAVIDFDRSELGPKDAPGHDTEVDLSDSSARALVAKAAEDDSRIDALVLYTDDARAGAGGTSQIQAAINLAALETNTSYQNSGVVQRLTLVRMEEVAYAETGNMNTDLDRLSNTNTLGQPIPPDGHLDIAQSLRETHKADLVHLITENGGGVCGLAWHMNVVSASFERFAYGVTARPGCLDDLTMPHEMGHNMGGRHDRFVDPQDGPYTYSHGFVDPTLPKTWVTIMAYTTGCGPTCTYIQHFSNPDVRYENTPTGIAEGQSNAADMRKTLNNTALTVANFRVNVPLPAKPTLVSPSGSTSDTTPTYTWNAVSGATHYQLWVNRGSTTVHNVEYTASATLCSSGTGTCFLTPTTALSSGSHTWWVRAKNSAGYGPWSQGMSFTVGTTAPGQPTLVSPTGNVTDTRPTYTWNAVAGATEYQLWVNRGRTTVINAMHTATAAGCSGGTGTCSITPTTVLAAGGHAWWIRAKNGAGAGPWSTAKTFTIVTPPAQPTLVSPAGNVTDTTPTYTWNAVASATEYQLWVNRGSTTVINTVHTSGAAGCGDGTCEITPATVLTAGGHTWWVRAKNTAGLGPWSTAKTFTVQ